MSKKYMMKFTEVFTDMPIGRYRKDGDHSGEVFREDFLIPALEKNPKVILDLDGAYGFGSSFLDEAFAGIIRNKTYTLDELQEKLEIVCTDDPETIKQIQKYLLEATK